MVKKKGELRKGIQKKKSLVFECRPRTRAKECGAVVHAVVKTAGGGCKSSSSLNNPSRVLDQLFEAHQGKEKAAQSAVLSSVNHFTNIVFEFIHDHLLYAGFVLLIASIVLFMRKNPNYSTVFVVAMAIIVLQSVTLLSEWLFDEAKARSRLSPPVLSSAAPTESKNAQDAPSPNLRQFAVADQKKATEKVTVAVKPHELLQEKIDHDLPMLLKTIDELLGRLPDDEIERFAKSPEFKHYEQVMGKYNVK